MNRLSLVLVSVLLAACGAKTDEPVFDGEYQIVGTSMIYSAPYVTGKCGEGQGPMPVKWEATLEQVNGEWLFSLLGGVSVVLEQRGSDFVASSAESVVEPESSLASGGLRKRVFHELRLSPLDGSFAASWSDELEYGSGFEKTCGRVTGKLEGPQR